VQARRGFERMLEALVRAGAIAVREDTFQKEGQAIRFRRAHLPREWREALESGDFVLEDDGTRAEGPGRGRAKPVAPKVRKRKRAAAQDAPAAQWQADPDAGVVDRDVVERLRQWRLGVTRARGIPAFRIMTDRTMNAIAAVQPRSLDALQRVPGLNTKTLASYGAAILEAVRG
jgi:DNA topoisomerase-3